MPLIISIESITYTPYLRVSITMVYRLGDTEKINAMERLQQEPLLHFFCASELLNIEIKDWFEKQK